jgi:hypothetical protein
LESDISGHFQDYPRKNQLIPILPIDDPFIGPSDLLKPRSDPVLIGAFCERNRHESPRIADQARGTRFMAIILLLFQLWRPIAVDAQIDLQSGEWDTSFA